MKLEDGRVLTEVAAILYYIARAHPDAALWPEKDVTAQAEVMSWMSYCASTLHPARRQGPQAAFAVYRIADHRLGANVWVAGAYSIADIHLFRLYWRLKNSLHPEPRQLPSLDRHYDQMMERAAVKKAIKVESSMGYELPG